MARDDVRTPGCHLDDLDGEPMFCKPSCTIPCDLTLAGATPLEFRVDRWRGNQHTRESDGIATPSLVSNLGGERRGGIDGCRAGHPLCAGRARSGAHDLASSRLGFPRARLGILGLSRPAVRNRRGTHT